MNSIISRSEICIMKKKIDYFLNTRKEVNFIGTTISPHNLFTYLEKHYNISNEYIGEKSRYICFVCGNEKETFYVVIDWLFSTIRITEDVPYGII